MNTSVDQEVYLYREQEPVNNVSKCRYWVLLLLALHSAAANTLACTLLFTSLHSFNSTDGRLPQAPLVQGSDGNFYGTTASDGAYTNGTVFRISPVPPYTLTTLHSFGNGTDGKTPSSVLVQGTDGNFYGTTEHGGTSDGGTVYRISPTAPYTVRILHSFSSADGSVPESGLLLANDGNFYGVTVAGGAGGNGTVYRIGPTSPYPLTTLHSFTGADGSQPACDLVQGSDDNLYGTTGGGSTNLGTVFRISPVSPYTMTALHFFAGTDGSAPRAGVVFGNDGNLYGTTAAGGATNDGTVFRISPASPYTLTTLHSFTGSDGQSPYAALVLGADGNFYGTTGFGGANGIGTVFAISPASPYTLNTVYSFSGSDGQQPYAALARGNDNGLYGTTGYGGATGYQGTVFKVACSANCLTLQCSNIVVQTCNNCTTVPFATTVAETCTGCSNVDLQFSPPTNTCFAVNTTNLVEAIATDSCGNVATNYFTVTMLSSNCCNGPLVYRGNSTNVPPTGTFAPDQVAPLVILGEYNPSAPLPGSGLQLPSGSVQDVQFYGKDYNFTLYALAYAGPGAHPDEQTFQVVASEPFSGSFSNAGPHIISVTNAFLVNCGDLLAFAGVGPYYPNFTPEDQPSFDATYADATNWNSGYPLAFQATSPGENQTFTLGISGDTNATYGYIPNVFNNQGRYYAIGVDILECGRCTSNCISITCPGNIVTSTCSNNVAVFYTAEATDNCTNAPRLVLFNPPSGSLFAAGTTTPVTVTASDALGNAASCTFTVTVLSNNCCNLVLNCSNLTIVCGSPIPTNPPAYIDPCCTNVTVSLIGSSTTGNGCTQIVSQTWQAIDLCYGITNTCVRTITLLPPTNNCIIIVCPTNLVTLYSCGSNCVANPAVFNAALVTDSCNPTNLVITYNPPTNYCFPPGITPVTVAAYDPTGVSSNSCTFDVQVLMETNPNVSLTVTNVLIAACSNGCGLMPDVTGYVLQSETYGTISVSQSIPPEAEVCANTNVEITISNACGFLFRTNLPVTTQLTCETASSCLAFEVSNIVVTTCGTNPVPVFFPTLCITPVCCDNSAQFYYCPPSGTFLPPGTTNVQVTAWNECGITNTQYFTVTVVPDANPPIITNVPSYICVPTNTAVTGRIVVDSELSDLVGAGFSDGDGAMYALNVASYLTHGKQGANILIYSDTYDDGLLAQTLTGAGYSVTKVTGLSTDPITGITYANGFPAPLAYYLTNGDYAAVFLGGYEPYYPGKPWDGSHGITEYLSPTVDIPVLLNFVTNGGGVHLACGGNNLCNSGANGNDAEIQQWNDILDPFGLSMPSPNVNLIGYWYGCGTALIDGPDGNNGGTVLSVANGTLTVAPSPVMSGINAMVYDTGNNIGLLGNSPIAQIVEFDSTNQLIGVSGCIIATNNGCGVMPNAVGQIGLSCPYAVTVTQSIPPGTQLCANTNVIFTIADACGIVTNITVPVTIGSCGNCLNLECPTNIVATTCSNTALVTLAPAVSGCTNNVSLLYILLSGYLNPGGIAPVTYPFPVGTTPVTVYALDAGGNTLGTCAFNVNVLSGSCCTNPPVLVCPSNIVVSAACGCTQVYYSPEASSTCCSNVSVVAYPPSGYCFPVGTNTVTAVATDCYGNSNVCSFTVTVIPIAQCVAGVTWLQQTNPAGMESLASSADGSRLVLAGYPGQIYTSADFGVTWKAGGNSPSLRWIPLASSADGSRLVAAGGTDGSHGQIYTSSDYGATWSAQNSGTQAWARIASSSDGRKLVATVSGGQIYTSTDYGTNWTAQNSGVQNWFAVASSSDGTKLVATTGNGAVYTSTDSGTNWTPRYTLANNNWFASVVSSADGTRLVAVSGGAGAYTSTDSGLTWTLQNNGVLGLAVASSADGSKLLAAGLGSQVFISSDYGTNWTTEVVTTNSVSTDVRVASSADGSRLAALVLGGSLYTSGCTNTPCCLPPPPNMVLWLPFDETSGNISANLASPPDYGTQINNPTPYPGVVADSLFFNGNNYVVVPDYPGIEIGANSLTIDAWVNLAGTAPTNYVIVSKRSDTSVNGYSLYLNPGTGLVFDMSGQEFDNHTVLTSQQWHFVAVSVNKSLNFGFFLVDGQVVGTFGPLPATVFNTNSLGVAANPLMPPPLATPTPSWVGGLDEVEIYNRALGTNELVAIYSAGSAGKCKPCCYLRALTITEASPDSVQVTWGGCGVLEQAPTLKGPWTPIQSAASPYIVRATGAAMFYRLVCPEALPPQ